MDESTIQKDIILLFAFLDIVVETNNKNPLKNHFLTFSGILPVNAHAEVNILNLNYMTDL